MKRLIAVLIGFLIFDVCAVAAVGFYHPRYRAPFGYQYAWLPLKVIQGYPSGPVVRQWRQLIYWEWHNGKRVYYDPSKRSGFDHAKI